MSAIKSPFSDAIASKVPMKGSKGVYDHEPHLPAGMPGRSGGVLPEKTRDDITPKVPSWQDPGSTFIWGR